MELSLETSLFFALKIQIECFLPLSMNLRWHPLFFLCGEYSSGYFCQHIKNSYRDFLGGPAIEKLPCNAGDLGLIPVGELGSHIPGETSLCATAGESAPQEKILHGATKILCDTMKICVTQLRPNTAK